MNNFGGIWHRRIVKTSLLPAWMCVKLVSWDLTRISYLESPKCAGLACLAYLVGFSARTGAVMVWPTSPSVCLRGRIWGSMSFGRVVRVLSAWACACLSHHSRWSHIQMVRSVCPKRRESDSVALLGELTHVFTALILQQICPSRLAQMIMMMMSSERALISVSV